jgi:sec-independent protein translocase protein TatA
MGISGIGIWQLLIILMIVIMLFGSKRLGSLGSDLGTAIKGFRKNVGDTPDSEDMVAAPVISEEADPQGKG